MHLRSCSLVLALVAIAGCKRNDGRETRGIDAAFDAGLAQTAERTTATSDAASDASTVSDAGASPSASSMPAGLSAAARERWELSTDLIRGTSLRLETPKKAWEPSEPRRPTKLGGLDVKRGTEKPLSPDAVAKLMAMLRAPSAFDDDVQRRCAMDRLVGFRLERNSLGGFGRSLGEVTLDLFMDLNCTKFFLIHEAGGSLQVHASHFVPSDTSVRDFLKAAFPDDPSVAGAGERPTK